MAISDFDIILIINNHFHSHKYSNAM